MTEDQTGAEQGSTDQLETLRVREQRALAERLALEFMHEVRGSLETLGNLTYLTEMAAGEADRVKLYMQIAEDELARVAAMAWQTLGISRATQPASLIDMVDLAESALRIHRRTMEQKRIRLTKTLPDELKAEVRHGQVLQVVSNLIVNAIEALPDEGTLTLRLRRRGDRVHLLVADNGHGIEEEHLSRLGEQFFTTKEGTGNGLGLALSRRIVEEHRGTMRVRSSVRPGRRGTVFRVCLPAQAVLG